jgi:hypothetical protein
MANPGRIKHKRSCKRGQYMVKGVSKRRWFDRYDIDPSSPTRALLKKDLRRELKEAQNGEYLG